MKKTWTIDFLAIASTALAALFVGEKIPHLVEQWRGSFADGNYSAHIPQLTLYGTTTCKYCADARAYLREAGVPFNDLLIDESKSSREKFIQLKQNAVPILVSVNVLWLASIKKIFSSLSSSQLNDEDVYEKSFGFIYCGKRSLECCLSPDEGKTKA